MKGVLVADLIANFFDKTVSKNYGFLNKLTLFITLKLFHVGWIVLSVTWFLQNFSYGPGTVRNDDYEKLALTHYLLKISDN